MNQTPNTLVSGLFSWRQRRFSRQPKPLPTRLAAAALILLTVVPVPLTSRAALMAYEGFNYPTGGGNLAGQSGGFGWNSVWQTQVTSSSGVASGSLVAGVNAPAGYDAHSTGNAAFTPNGTRTGRHLDTSAGGIFGQKGFINGNGVIGQAGKTIYISFLQQPNISNNNYYEFEIHRGNLNDPGRIGGIGSDTGNSTSVYLRTPSIGQNAIGSASTSVSFYVVRIDFLGGNDTVSVYQNPTTATEPGTPTLLETGAGDMSFDGFSFGAFVNGATVAHDEIRVGETWADVTSPGVSSAGIWDGGGADNNWSTGGNWDNDVVPVFASSLTLSGSTRLINNNDLSGVSANSITFSSTAGAFTLNGISLGLNGNIGFSGNPASLITQTINLALTPSVDFTVDTPANGDLSLNGNVLSTHGLTKIDNGILTLGGSNTFSALSASGGTNIITGNTTITGGSVFYLADGDFINSCKDTLIIQPGATLTVQGNYNDAGVIGRDSGSGTVIQNGGTFNFNIGNNHFLFIGASGSTATRSEYDMNGGLLDMNGNTLGVALGANAVITGLVNQVSGVITNVGQLSFSPFFSQGQGFYNLNGGSLYIGSGGVVVFSGGGYQMNLGGGTLGATASWSSVLNMSLTGTNGSVTVAPGGNTIGLSGVLSGPGGLKVSGAGVLELSGANTYTGDTVVNSGGTLQLDVTGSSSGAFRIAAGGVINLNFTGTYAVGSLFTNGVALPVGTYNSGNLPGFLAGSGNLQVASGISTGLWTGLGANNNWSTPANWDNNAVPIFPRAVTFAGSTRLANNNDLSAITISSLTFDSAAGAFVLSGNDITLSGPLSFNGNPASTVTQTVNMNMAWAADENLDTPANGNLTLNGNISASANALTKSDFGTLTLGGTDSLLGHIVNSGTEVINGNVSVTGSGGTAIYLGNANSNFNGTVVIQPSGSLSVSGSFNDAMVIGRDGGSGKIIQNGGTFSYNVPGHSTLFVGATSHAGTQADYDMNGGVFNMNGETLGIALGDNGVNYTATLNQTNGAIQNVFTLDLGAARAFGTGVYNLSGGSITIDIGGIISDSGFYAVNLGGGTIAASSGWSSPLNMTLTGTNGSVTFNTQGNTITLSGALTGPGGLIVAGGGILDLSGANNYLGNTLVSSGILQLDSASSSPGAFRVVDGGLFNLNFTGNFIVPSLFTNGVSLPIGIYNSGNLSSFISGSGNLQVVGAVSTGIWTGLGTDNHWSTAGNWDNNAVPVFPHAVTFAGTSKLNNNNDLAGITVSSITFNSNAGAFTLNGNDITLSGGIGFAANPAAPVTQTVNLNMTWPGNETIDTPTNGNLVLGGNISSTSALIKSDAGNLTLGGTDTISTWNVNGGTNIITGSLSVNGTGGSTFYVGNGGNLQGAIIMQPGSAITVSGSFGDNGVLGRNSGSSVFIQNGGTFSYSGLQYLLVGATSSAGTRSEYDLNNGVLNLNGNNLGLALADQGVLSTGLVNQVGGVITNANELWLGTVFSTGLGVFNQTGGSLYLGAGGIITSGRYQINLGGGTVGAESTWSSTLNMTLTGVNGAAKFDPAGSAISLSGVLSGPGGLTVINNGTLELSGADNYTGDTSVTAGTLKLDSTNSTSGAFRLTSGATLNLNFASTLVTGSLFTNNVSLPTGTYNAGNLPAFITGAGSILVAGSLPSTPTNITFSVSGGNLNLSWPANYLGWILQQNTNSLNVSSNWFDVAGSASVTSTNIPINKNIPNVFYRMRHP